MDPNEKKIIEPKPEEKKTGSKQKRAAKHKQSKAEDIKASGEAVSLNVPQMSISAAGRPDTASGPSKDTKNLEPKPTGNQASKKQRNKKSDVSAQDVQATQKSVAANFPHLSISDAKENPTIAASGAGPSARKQDSKASNNKCKPKAKSQKKSKKMPLEDDVSIISEGGDVNKDRRKANAEDSFAELENLTGLNLNNAPAALRIRPKFQSGNEGRRTVLRSNFFRLKLSGSTVYQYDLAFDHPGSASIAEQEIEVGRKFRRVTKKIHQQLLAQFVNTSGRNLFNGISYAFDGDRILLTNKPIKANNLDEGAHFSFPFRENEEDRPANYEIRIKETNSVTLDFNFNGENYVHDRAVLQMLDIITKSYAFRHNIVYGSKIFFPANVRPRIVMNLTAFQNQSKVDRPTPFELAFGYHQSTQFCQSGPMQNIDRATAVLYREGPLIHRIFELLGRPISSNEELSYGEMDQLKEFIALRVETRYRGFVSRHSIRSFTRTSCAQTMFTNEDSQSSVADYFKEKYNIRLRYPLLPCIEYGQGKYLPIELCHLLPDQRNQRKLRDDLIKILSTHATSQKPSGRAAGTTESARSICSNPALAEFGITLNPNMVEVPGRILPAPKLRYSNDPTFVPVTPGDWNMQQPDKKKFYSSRNLSRWVIICLSRKIDNPIIGDFCRNLQRVGSMVGVEVNMPSSPIKTTKQDLRKTMESLKSQNLQLILCIIPEIDEIYTEIKSVGDRTLGVPTQIVLDKHYNPRGARQKLFDTAYLSNLLLKINSKIGGINLSLADVSKPSILKGLTMVVGVDVNHPSPGENSPSIAAVVGSLNPELSNYHTNIVINRSREETVDVRGMIKPILEAFKKHRGSYPDNIVVYRDGVSEGQFAYVLAYEVFPLRDMLSTDYRQTIKLTYMIVQKRHNARFFPTRKEDSTRSENILPGCVIDTTVCHYKWFDFYLCSQNSFLGTARPGKYTVLWDENNLTADELEKVTYYLCYLFARSTKSIADPAPARYAHHAAARGKVHLKDMMRTRSRMSANVDLSEAIRVVAPLQDVLYFI